MIADKKIIFYSMHSLLVEYILNGYPLEMSDPICRTKSGFIFFGGGKAYEDWRIKRREILRYIKR